MDLHSNEVDHRYSPTWTLLVASLALMMAFLDALGLALIPVARLRGRESRGGHSRLDILGAALVTTGLFAITGAIVRTNTTGWGDIEVIGALITGLAIVALFVAWVRRTLN